MNRSHRDNARIETMRYEMPEAFESLELPESWDNDLIIEPLKLPVSEDFLDLDSDTICSGPDDFLDGVFDHLLEDPPWRPPEIPKELTNLLDYSYGGSLSKNTSIIPSPDSLAFYLPYHYFPANVWGVYLLAEGILWLTSYILKETDFKITARQARKGAELFLYYHEAFHHKVEVFSTRMEITHRIPCFKKGFEQLYQRTLRSGKCREEGLANASALDGVKLRFNNDLLINALKKYIKDCPPSYKTGIRMVDKFADWRNIFAERCQRECFPSLPGKSPDLWLNTPNMFNGTTNIKSRVNYIIPFSSRIRHRLPFRACVKPNELIKKLNKLVALTFFRHGNNHDIYKAKNGRNISIPRHKGNLGVGLIRQILSDVGLRTSVKEFSDL